MITHIEQYQKAFLDFEESNAAKSNSALRQLRQAEWKSFSESGFPTLKHEEWKYTHAQSMVNFPYQIDNESLTNAFDIQSNPVSDALEVVLIDGVFSKQYTTAKNLPNAISITDLKEVIQKEEYYSAFSRAYKSYNADGFTSLNEAFLGNGVLIQVHKNAHVNIPLVVRHVQRSGYLAMPKVLVLLEENSSLSIVELFGSQPCNNTLYNGITEINQYAGSELHYYKVQLEHTANHVGTTQINQIGQSKSHSVTVSLGGTIVRNNHNVTFHTPESGAHVYGLAFIGGNTHVDNHTAVDHAVPTCESTELYKNIVSDKASAVFNGKIFVRKDAQKTNAYQSSKNILLSAEANAFSKPQLEIWADDVKCSHGSTTGQLDKDALFYLKARGIGEKQAIAMLTNAYANDILEKINFEPLKHYLEQKIQAFFA